MLGSFSFDRFKTKKSSKLDILLSAYESQKGLFDHEKQRLPYVDVSGWNWETGKHYAQAQNLARTWMETPANHLTPTKLAEEAGDIFGRFENCTFKAFDLTWIKEKKMNAFLSVTKGSAEAPKFLDIVYKGKPSSNEVDLALVGKGVTFDSGGISIKPSAGMAAMKADMGGAAVVLSALKAIVECKFPINIAVCVPLCENMPSGTATKPGDVVAASNGKTIEIDNTDAEGRLILADALVYAKEEHNPKKLIDVATLTGAMDVALGSAMAGVFTNKEDSFTSLRQVSLKTGDPLWLMPLHPQYSSQIKSEVADIRNVGGRGLVLVKSLIL
jgi:cytosol aminopeptidase